MLEGKRLIITGIVNDQSIAFACAKRAQELGAEIVATARPQDRELCEEAVKSLPNEPEVLDLDVTNSEHFDRVADRLRAKWGNVDGALHAVAFAPRETLAGDFLDVRPERVNLAFRTSSFSYMSLGRLLRDLCPPSGGSLVGLDFDAAVTWPIYNWMGVCKAALESINRYLAFHLGERLIRSNLIAAGPLETRAGKGIPNFEILTEAWAERAPLPWDPTDPYPVADAACFLFSDFSRAITGEILHVDSGFNFVAAGRKRDGQAGAHTGTS